MSNLKYKIAQMLEEIAGRDGRMVTGIPTTTNSSDAERIDALYEEEFEKRIAPLRRELAAIKRREQTYTENGVFEEMVPWYELTDEERESALTYFGDDDD
jgi:hypothetical protein